MDEKKYSQLYQALLQEVLQFHNGNQRRIRKGMLSLFAGAAGVPESLLLFLSEGSRVIFLLLWIVSMFGIAAYLIAVEYIDYEMQNKVKKITKKEVELDQLTPLPSAMPQAGAHLCRGPGPGAGPAPRPAPGGAGELCPVRRPGGGGSGPAAPGAAGRRGRACRTGAAAPPRRSCAAGGRRRLRPPVRRPGRKFVFGSPEAERLRQAGIRTIPRARPRFRACFCPGESRPCPAGIPGRPAACRP